MNGETRNDILSIARVLEKQAERCRIQRAALVKNASDDAMAKENAAIQTIGYVGAMASLLSSTLCEIVQNEQARDIFALGKTNCVLREWGLDELV